MCVRACVRERVYTGSNLDCQSYSGCARGLKLPGKAAARARRPARREGGGRQRPALGD